MAARTLSPRRELLERELELQAIAGLLATARSGTGALLLVRGAAGVGKTELLRAARRLAEESGMRVASARGTELEADLPYGLVRQLADRLLAGEDPATRADLLAGPAAAAVARVLEMAGPIPAAGDPALLIPHGLFWLIANLAARGPLLIAVDDAQWCDPASARFLAYLAPRLDGLPVLLAVAGRAQADGPDAQLDGAATDVIEPRELSPPAVAQLVRRTFSDDADARFCAACHSVTGGNPFYVHALVDELTAQGFCGTAAEVVRLEMIGPKTVAASVLVRLSRLGAPAVALARAAAILGEQAGYHNVLRLAGVDQSEAPEAIASLAESGLLEDARPLRLVHPIVRNAIYRDLTTTERAAAHKRAAELLLAEHAAIELVAAQLVLTDPCGDQRVVDALRRAAAEALARGGPDAAVAWLLRALAEPPADRPKLLFELGRAQALTHDPAALGHLTAAVDAGAEPALAVASARLMAHMLLTSARWPEALGVLDRLADLLGRHDRELALALASDRAFVARLTPLEHDERRAGVTKLRELLGDAIEHPGTPAERVAVTQIAVDETSLCAPAGKVVALARRALAGGLLLAEETADSPTYVVAASVLLYADELDEAAELFAAAIEDARARGSVAGFVMGCCFHAHAAFRAGRVASAEADARASLETEDKPMPQILPMQLAALLDALIERDQLELAERELATRGLAGAPTDAYHAAHMLESRSRLRLAQGRPDRALPDALDAGRRQQLMQMPNPAIVPWRSTAARAAAAVGEHARARELAAEELGLARTFGAPRAVGIALRAFAVICDGRRRIERLQEAVDVLANSPARLEHAHALVDLGAALCRERQRVIARDPLRQGLDIALAAGSVALARRASEELAASGAKPRRARVTGPDALTPSERRIARMAAEGMSNSQIAQVLFVVPRTVEMHLTSVYRKLAIDSRTQLGDALT